MEFRAVEQKWMFTGSKYGGYGTFLPTHARTPSLLANPHPPPHGVEPARVAAEEFVEVMALPLPFCAVFAKCEE